MRPEKVSATTGPADLDSTTGCSPIGSPGKSPRFVPIPHGNKGLRNRRMPRTQVSRFKVLGWQFPKHIFDLHTAYLAASNVLLPYNPDEVRKRPRKGLSDACRAYA